jgi:uncharacterized membrane protein
MKISKLVVGILVIALSALLLASAVLTYLDPTNALFSQTVVNIIIALVLIILAADYFNEAKE